MSDSQTGQRRRNLRLVAVVAAACAVVAFLLAALITSIFQRKQEAKNPYVRLVEVNEETTDPAVWGVNWAREYDDYKRTADASQTRFGGSETLPDREGEDQSLAHAHVCRLRLCDRLPRPARPCLHAPGSGADEARHRAAAAGLVPAVPYLGHSDLPAHG